MCTVAVVLEDAVIVQVVNGMMYTLTLLVGRSDCRNDGKYSTLEECPVELGTVCCSTPSVSFRLCKITGAVGIIGSSCV